MSAGAATAATLPLSYLVGYGDKADPVVSLTWGLLIISIAVVVIITALVVIGVARRRVRGPVTLESIAIERSGTGLRWISVGVGLSTVVLLAALFWTVAVLAKINSPSSPADLTIEVTGQQWWWKARYLNDDPSRVLTVANEIHVPVGRPVRVRLIGADVIHSFWIPALTGKTDAIPGQTNLTWFEASTPGIYRGQCTEYCGEQHAHMAFTVVAQAPQQFDDWWKSQIEAAPAPQGEQAIRGEQDFELHCGACHAVRGTRAGGSVAPDLTHLMSRSTLAAGTLPNTPGNLAGWIADPQQVKPGTLMPTLYLSGNELSDITTYLATLQ
jgi:cytochrome c oxidase subunit 2